MASEAGQKQASRKQRVLSTARGESGGGIAQGVQMIPGNSQSCSSVPPLQAPYLSCSAPLRTSQTGVVSIAASSDHTDLQAIYFELGRAGGRVFSLAPKDSMVRIYVFRAGRAARLGHNHVLSAPEFTGFFHLPTSGAGNGRF